MSQHFDVLIRGADVYDGSGSPAVRADVGVEADRIAAIGSLDSSTATKDIDAAGLTLAPGFIDVHTHDDFAALIHPDMAFKTCGGVTTCIVGNCGFGPAPFAAASTMLGTLLSAVEVAPYEGHEGYLARLDANPPGANIGVLAGHGTLRLAAMGLEAGEPDASQLETMKSLLREGLEAGILGLSSGLIYEPGRYARTEELAELASEMRGTGALYATHMRDEGAGLPASVEEAIAIGHRAGVPVQISHHKASGRENWGLVTRSIALIEAAQARGEDVHADQYPYTAGSTQLKAVLENGAFTEGGRSGGIGTVAPGDVIVASAPGFPEWEGETIEALARGSGQPARLAAEQIAARSPGVTVILHMMSEADVRAVMRHPSTMIGSDGLPTLEGKPHPRLYNTFARVLGHYSRDLGLFDLTTAIYKMTGFSARKFGLEGRGAVAIGAFADLVLFDAERVIDRGTFDAPNRYPDGITHVLVNGQLAVEHGELRERGAGRALRRG